METTVEISSQVLPSSVEPWLNSSERLDQTVNRREEELKAIRRLKNQLALHEGILRLLEKHDQEETQTPGRFTGVKPRIAFIDILNESGKAITEAELIDTFVAGGGIIGQVRGRANPTSSLHKMLEQVKPKLKKSNERIGLAVWKRDQFLD